MSVTVTYMAQLKQAAGVASETIELPPDGSVRALVHLLANRHEEPLRGLLLDAVGSLQPTILVFVNDTQLSLGSAELLQDGDEVTFLSPMAGG